MVDWLKRQTEVVEILAIYLNVSIQVDFFSIFFFLNFRRSLLTFELYRLMGANKNSML